MPPVSGGCVADTQLPAQSQGNYIVLELADQKHCLEPLGERQVRTVENGTGPQAGLMAAGATLPVNDSFGAKTAGLMVPTLRTLVAIWPAGFLQGFFALFFTAILLKKFAHTQTCQW